MVLIKFKTLSCRGYRGIGTVCPKVLNDNAIVDFMLLVFYR